MSNILSLLLWLPLLGAVATLFVPGRIAKPFALAFSLVPLVLAAWLWSRFDPSLTGFQFMEDHAWLPALGIHYRLGVDGLAVPFILLTALLTPICLLASWHITARAPAFFALFLALEGLVIGVFTALDLVLFYIFFEAVLIPMYLLIGMWGGENRMYAALKFFLYTFAGSILMLIAVIVLGQAAGHYDMTLLSGLSIPLLTQKLLFVALFAAFAVKVPMWPFHTWLPDAHVQAPTAGSVMLAGVLLKLGAYGFLRLSLPVLPEASAYFAPFIFALSGIAVVYAAWVAYVQTDIKKIIAYSSVSHMGLVTLGLFAGTQDALNGALLVMVNHGIVSAGLFLCIGVIYERLHTRELANFGALARTMPAYAFVTMLLTLAAVALPGTNSFVGEFLGLAGSWASTLPGAKIATVAATTGVIFGALYMLHMYRGMFYGTESAFSKKHGHGHTDLTVREWVYFAPLLVLIPLLGLMPALATDMWRQPVTSLADVAARVNQPAVVVEDLTAAPVLPEGVSPSVVVSGTAAVSVTTPVSATVESTKR